MMAQNQVVSTIFDIENWWRIHRLPSISAPLNCFSCCLLTGKYVIRHIGYRWLLQLMLRHWLVLFAHRALTPPYCWNIPPAKTIRGTDFQQKNFTEQSSKETVQEKVPVPNRAVVKMAQFQRKPQYIILGQQKTLFLSHRVFSLLLLYLY